MSEENKPKQDIKKVRKIENFMKVLHTQYTNSEQSLNDVAEFLSEKYEGTVTGRTIGNDFKGFGWGVKTPRRKGSKLDASKLDLEEQWKIFKKIEILYKLKKYQKQYGTVHAFVPKDVMKALEDIALDGLGIEKIREHGKEIGELEKELVKKDRRIAQLESERSSFLIGIQKYASSQSKNPLSKHLE